MVESLPKQKNEDGEEFVELYRGVRLMEKLLELYKAKIGNGQIIFNGFTSTSVSRERAVGFAYKD